MITNKNDHNGSGHNGNGHTGNGYAGGSALPERAGVVVEDAPDADEFPFVRDERRGSERAAKQTATKESDALSNEDALSSEVVDLELGEGDAEATPDIKRHGGAPGSRLKRLLIALAVLAVVGATVAVAGYVVFFGGRAKREMTFQRGSAAQSAKPVEDELKRSVTAEEIGREMREGRGATATAANAESQTGSTSESQSGMQTGVPPTMPQVYSELGGSSIGGRPIVDSYSSTVNPSSPSQIQNQRKGLQVLHERESQPRRRLIPL